ncbi:chemotaxis protein CheW [Terrilactibacillus sp. BCM23-1]|uniref:Chemotaxis protein CheW n=1 Tax=Terrilactibacillus tamarindi TaxID=2599694 RepID=A0A6N8CST2_9BACI|nr:chemotaxis protein CheW [Terrilactibacillus tamarindi]MTT32257.1 chemotaxis protein CheW [Terrilactibacillus tamarindi]
MSQLYQNKKVILFELNEETYGVSIDHVVSIERPQAITRVPHVQAYVKGIMTMRGLMIPVIDMHKRFNMAESLETTEERIIIVEMDDIMVGLFVDSAHHVVDLSPSQIEDAPDIVGGLEAAYIDGIARYEEDKLLVLLNLKQVLTTNEVNDLKKIEA